MSFFVVAISPEGHPLTMGLGQERPDHALSDRDSLRDSYLRYRNQGWRVEVEDADGRTVEWSDLETSVTAGDAA